MKSFKNRTLDASQPAMVYRNLNKGGYSIKQGRLVVAHTDSVMIRDASVQINAKAQQQVREAGVRNVHAYLVGFVSYKPELRTPHCIRVQYNPHTDDTFMYQGKPLEDGRSISLNNKGCFVAL